MYNTDIAGPVLNHKHTLNVHHVFPKCVHIQHAQRRVVENKEIKTKRGRQRKSSTNYIFISHIPTLRTDPCAIYEQPVHCCHHQYVCLSPAHTASSEFGHTVSPQFHHRNGRIALQAILKQKRKRCPVVEKRTIQVGGRSSEDWDSYPEFRCLCF